MMSTLLECDVCGAYYVRSLCDALDCKVYEQPLYQAKNLKQMNEKLKTILMEYTDWNGTLKKKAPLEKAGCACCTCSDCKRHYDDCVCEHNEIVDLLLEEK
jgi:hypothetical protein